MMETILQKVATIKLLLHTALDKLRERGLTGEELVEKSTWLLESSAEFAVTTTPLSRRCCTSLQYHCVCCRSWWFGERVKKWFDGE